MLYTILYRFRGMATYWSKVSPRVRCLRLCKLTNVMMSLARSRARSGETKHASPFNETPASYMFWLLRSCTWQPTYLLTYLLHSRQSIRHQVSVTMVCLHQALLTLTTGSRAFNIGAIGAMHRGPLQWWTHFGK